MQPVNLISTVGASFLYNLSESSERQEDKKDLLKAIQVAWNAQKWPEVTCLMRKIDPADRICGAEINTIHELIEKRRLVAKNADLHFCLSDTEAGRQMQMLLQSFYKDKHRVVSHIIEGLQETDENRFRCVGLRRLVQKIAEITRNSGGSGCVAINATGGYKAQIALSAVIGQAMGIPVYYKHEKFPGIIALPPMPIAFDFDLFLREADLLLSLEQEDCIPLERELDDALLPLLEEIEEGGYRYFGLSAMGQLYLESFRLRYPPEKTLPGAVPPAEKRPPTFRQDHYPDGFKDYVKKVWDKTPYIISCYSLPYDKQKGIRDKVFYHCAQSDKIIGEYLDHHRFGGRFAIETSAHTQAQKMAVIDDLTRRFGGK